MSIPYTEKTIDKLIHLDSLIHSKTKYDLKLTILGDILKLEPCSKRGNDYLSDFTLFPRLFAKGSMYIADDNIIYSKNCIFEDLDDKELIYIFNED
jgi:hypothetical protein